MINAHSFYLEEQHDQVAAARALAACYRILIEAARAAERRAQLKETAGEQFAETVVPSAEQVRGRVDTSSIL